MLCYFSLERKVTKSSSEFDGRHSLCSAFSYQELAGGSVLFSKGSRFGYSAACYHTFPEGAEFFTEYSLLPNVLFSEK